MSEDDDEREVRRETTFWGTEKEVVYENGERVGEIRTEERGGILGFGGTPVRVEYRDGVEVGYEKTEERGGILGFGTHEEQVRYNPDDEEVGHSRVEERGGILGFGTHHVRVGYDNDGNEVDRTTHERRGGILGFGGETVRVTRSTSSRPSNDAGSGGSSYSGSSASSTADLSALGSLVKSLVILVVVGYLAHAGYKGCTAWLKDATKPKPVRKGQNIYPPLVGTGTVPIAREPTSLCGYPAASPAHDLLVAPWVDYQCRDGSEDKGCLARRVYTQEQGRGCPGAELCCPPATVPALEVEEQPEDEPDLEPVPTMLEVQELYANREHSEAMAAAQRRFARVRDPEALLVIVNAACKLQQLEVARDAFAQLDEDLRSRTRAACRNVELGE